MRARSRLVAAGAAALLATSCQLDLVVDVGLEAGGSGRFQVVVALDEELTHRLEEAGVDLLAGIDDVRDVDGRWDVVDERTADGGLLVRLRSRFRGPGDLQALVDDLHAPLDDEDLRLFDRLAVEALDGGAVRFTGDVGLRLPAAPGARGAGVDVTTADVERLLRERPDLVDYELRVRLPAPPREHDADEVDGETLVWRVPVGGTRAVTAVSDEPSGAPVLLIAAGIVGTAIIAGVAAVALRRWG